MVCAKQILFCVTAKEAVPSDDMDAKHEKTQCEHLQPNTSVGTPAYFHTDKDFSLWRAVKTFSRIAISTVAASSTGMLLD